MRWVPLHLVQHLKAGRPIIARIEPVTSDGIAWVKVAPYKKSNLLSYDSRMSLPPGTLENEPWLYLVRKFEASKDLVEGEEQIAIEQLTYDERYQVTTLEEVDDLLGRLVGDPSKFVAVADYPGFIP